MLQGASIAEYNIFLLHLIFVAELSNQNMSSQLSEPHSGGLF